MNKKHVKEKYALLTVSERKGLVDFARGLRALNYKLVASKRTTIFLRRHNVEVTEVSEITGYNPIMGKQGIKLIHPKIFGAILADPKIKSHQEDMERYGIHPFSLVVCNFYPFEKAISKKKVNHEKAIYHLDIGGPAMVRCAAKNYKNTTIITDPEDYDVVLHSLKELGEVPYQIRRSLSLKAFKFTKEYDEAIIEYLRKAHEEEDRRECKQCLNTTKNPLVKIGKNGLCHVCDMYEKGKDSSKLERELEILKGFIGKGKGRYDAMVGISGGKDSSATLYTVKEMGFSPLAFTFDVGYYPEHTFDRAHEVAQKLHVDYEKISIRHSVSDHDKASYRKTVELYELPNGEATNNLFRYHYLASRKHYSASCTHSLPFVRICQLCRHTVVKSYYKEARKRGIQLIILGINEWTGLSQKGKASYEVSGIRALQPYKNEPPIYIVHLPFLLSRTVEEVQAILKNIGWEKPQGEDLIESNSNSCLLSKAIESTFIKRMGFHPDTMRLSREVTVGFMTKEQARKALEKPHQSSDSLREILEKASII